MFDICSTGTAIILEDDLIQPAKIIINDFSEWMHIPISYWNMEDYKGSWKKSINEGIKFGDHAALITSMRKPEYLNFISTWILYFDIQQVFVQNTIIFVHEYESFDVNKINKFVGSRESYDEDGMKISEWVTSLSSIKEFYNRL